MDVEAQLYLINIITSSIGMCALFAVCGIIIIHCYLPGVLLAL